MIKIRGPTHSNLICLILTSSTLTLTTYLSLVFFSFADLRDIDISLRGRLAERLLSSVTLEMLRITVRGGLARLDFFVGEFMAKEFSNRRTNLAAIGSHFV